MITVINGQVIEGVAGHASLTETVGFLTAVTLLAASATAYLFGRLGFYYRTKEGRRTPEQAAACMTRFCSCGVFNPARAARLLEPAARGESPASS